MTVTWRVVVVAPRIDRIIENGLTHLRVCYKNGFRVGRTFRYFGLV